VQGGLRKISGMMNEKRREEMARKIENMGRYRALTGATVLEIGADKDGYAAQMMIDAGASKVISSNYNANWPTGTFGAIERQRIDARKLEDALEPESVDIIFGAAVLEHINGLAEFFAGSRRVLKPRGLFFVHGGPIWTSPKGHHVFAKGEKMHYRFGVPGANPVADWAHLLHTRASLAEELIATEIPPGDAEKIVTWIYDGESINRVGYRTMCETFDASDLEMIDRWEAAFRHPEPELLEAIERGPHSGQERYDVSGITFIAQA
jgi:SAM-dependent methyltransferase